MTINLTQSDERRAQDRRSEDRRKGRLDELFTWAIAANVFIDLRKTPRRSGQDRRYPQDNYLN